MGAIRVEDWYVSCGFCISDEKMAFRRDAALVTLLIRLFALPVALERMLLTESVLVTVGARGWETGSISSAIVSRGVSGVVTFGWRGGRSSFLTLCGSCSLACVQILGRLARAACS